MIHPRRGAPGPVRARVAVTLLCGLVLAVGPLAAQDDDTEKSGDLIDSLQVSLDIVEKGLARDHLTNSDIASIRRHVDFVAESARSIRASAKERLAERRRLLNAMEPRPAEDDPPEPERIAAERKRLEESVAEHQGRVKSANVMLARVDELRSRLAREEFNVLARVLGQQTETPLAPTLAGEAVASIPSQLDRFNNRVADWWRNVEFDRARFGTLMWWLVLLVFVMAVILPTRNWLLRVYGPDHRDESPSFPRRFRVMIAVGLGNVVLPVVSIVGLYVVLLKSGAPTAEVGDMVWILMVTLCQFFLITGLAAAAMSPVYPEWRISHFTDASAVRLYRSIRLFALLIAVVNLISIPITDPDGTRQFAEVLVADVSHDALHTVFGALVVAIIALSMLNILRADNWWFVHADESGERYTVPPSTLVRGLFIVAKAGLLLSVLAALIGYVNLGIFLSQRVVWSLLLIAFAYLLRAFVAATCSRAAGDVSDADSLLGNTLGYSRSGAERLMFWVMLGVDVVLSVAAIIFLLLIWGVRATDVQNTASRLFYGVSVGEYTFSLVDVGLALGIFVLLFIGVRLFQGFLSNRVLAQTVPDVGVRDALTTGVGYVGIIVAAIVAISSLGLELSQLAIIFGALSVGIGFGLQHVVNNFVSGLILLMHRPVKAGDWIVVGQYEGYVKKINVVATEIQTFDNAEVIVPNSQLVSSEVLNWTHKSTVARVIVSVSVAYDSDPEQVRDVLLRCAEDNDDVLKTPAPVVVFRDFGENGMVFELRFFIKQADYMLLTASDLRFVVFSAFRGAGITIPFPQRDIHIRTPGSISGEGGRIAGAGTADDEGASSSPGRGRRHKDDTADQQGDGD